MSAEPDSRRSEVHAGGQLSEVEVLWSADQRDPAIELDAQLAGQRTARSPSELSLLAATAAMIRESWLPCQATGELPGLGP